MKTKKKKSKSKKTLNLSLLLIFSFIFCLSFSSGYDITNFTKEEQISVNADVPGSFYTNGTSIIYNDWSGVSIYQYNCDEKYNLSSCSYSDNINFMNGSYPNQNNGVFVSDDYMFITDKRRDYHFRYDCSTPYDLSSCSYNDHNKSTGDGTYDIVFNSDGTSYIESQLVGDNSILKQFDCSDPYNLTSCSYTDELEFSTGDNNDINSIYFTNDKLYLSDNNIGLHQLDCTGFDITTCSLNSTKTLSSSTSGVYVDGEILLHMDSTNKYLEKWIIENYTAPSDEEIEEENFIIDTSNNILDLFPDSDDLGSGQKIMIVVLVMGIVTASLILGTTTKEGGISTGIIYLVAFVNLMLFIMFISLEYINIGVLILILLGLLAVAYFKFKGNS